LIVAGLLGAIHPRVAVLAALAWVAAGVCAPLVARRLARGAGTGVVAGRAEMHALAVDGVQGLADLAALGADARHAAAMADAARRVAAHERRAARGTATGAAIGGLTVDLAAIGVLALCVPLVGAGHVQGVVLAVAVLATIASFEALAGLPAAWQGLDASGAAAARLWDVLDDTPAVVSPATPAPLPAARDLEVRRLEFTYPGAISRAVCDLSFRLEPGRMVAIVGPSGAGKSTVAHLLLRFWEVPRGSVFVGGRDVRDHDPDDVRRLFGFAGQRAHLFTGTVRDNLLVGRPGASAADLDRALGRAHLGAAIDACPDRLDTWIGERGHALSGGERQRLGLARALLAETPFLLLDEPTANVDPETEHALMGEIRACAVRRGVLLITHRLVGLDRADEIIVLREGIVVERGSFGELVARGGLFRRMLDLQRSAAIVDTEP
jgi:ABC-type transport system involved in cytochrome bd biosynthesis fused ATPase/permease subunit